MADNSSSKGDIFRSEFFENMGMTSGETTFKPNNGGAENHIVGPGKPGEVTGSYTYHTDRSGNVSPGAHEHLDYTKKGNG